MFCCALSPLQDTECSLFRLLFTTLSLGCYNPKAADLLKDAIQTDGSGRLIISGFPSASEECTTAAMPPAGVPVVLGCLEGVLMEPRPERWAGSQAVLQGLRDLLEYLRWDEEGEDAKEAEDADVDQGAADAQQSGQQDSSSEEQLILQQVKKREFPWYDWLRTPCVCDCDGILWRVWVGLRVEVCLFPQDERIIRCDLSCFFCSCFFLWF